MNFIFATGGNRFQRDIAYKVVSEMIDTLMPRIKTFEIEVKIRKFSKEDDAVGYCNMLDNNREFEIEVSRDLTLKDFVTTICHEMVHVKQYARKEMTDDLVENGNAVWKRRKVNPNTKYYDLPWEKEAYRLQDKLAKKVWDADVL